MALHTIARRWAALDTEIRALDRDIKTILDTIAAPLLARHGVGYHTAGSLLCAAGDNPDRLATEASFAALCGTSPVAVSSGRSNRHRLNRAGTDKPTPPCGASSSSAYEAGTRPRRTTSSDASPPGTPNATPSDASLGEYPGAGHGGLFVGNGEGRPRCLATRWPV